MKHWDERERADVKALRLSPAERERLRALMEPPARQRRSEPQVHSLVGLAIALTVLVGLAVLLAPSDPVSSRLIQ